VIRSDLAIGIFLKFKASKLALHNAIAYAVLGFADGAFIPALDQRMLRPFGNPAYTGYNIFSLIFLETYKFTP
jgi:hypothetical protein